MRDNQVGTTWLWTELQNLHKTWTESEEKVMEMDHRKIEVDGAHRTGKPTTGPGDRPRPIMVKFLRFKDKVAVLERT